MNVLAMMLNAASLANLEMKKAVQKAAGCGGAGYRKNKMTVATGRALLLAFAMQHKAKADISRLLRM